jgi:hypothetical protein
LPPSWDTVVVRDLFVGQTRIDARFVQDAGRLSVALSAEGPAVELEVVLPVPPGNRGSRLVGGPAGEPGAGSVRQGRHDDQYPVTVHVSTQPAHIELEWAGGVSVDPPTVDLEPGQKSRGIRVLDFWFEEGEWKLLLEGEAERDYELGLYGEPVRVVEGPGTVSTGEDKHILTVAFPTGQPRSTTTIVLGGIQD